MKDLYERLDTLDYEDMEKHCEYIELAMDLMPDKGQNCNNGSHAVTGSVSMNKERKADQEVYTQLFAEHLLTHMIRNEKGTQVSWITVQ